MTHRVGISHRETSGKLFCYTSLLNEILKRSFHRKTPNKKEFWSTTDPEQRRVMCFLFQSKEPETCIGDPEVFHRGYPGGKRDRGYREQRGTRISSRGRILEGTYIEIWRKKRKTPCKVGRNFLPPDPSPKWLTILIYYTFFRSGRFLVSLSPIILSLLSVLSIN